MEECRRQQAAMIENLHRSAAPHFREQAAKLGRVHAEKLPALSEEQHGPSVRFQAMCEAFDGSADLYSNYRHLCGYTHAGVPLASWLVFDCTDPRQFFTVQLVGRIALLALGWSSRAFDSVHRYLRGYESRIRFRLSLDHDCPTTCAVGLLNLRQSSKARCVGDHHCLPALMALRSRLRGVPTLECSPLMPCLA
jgi:hypothetical protein